MSYITSVTGRQLLSQPRLTDDRYGDVQLVDVRPLVDFETRRIDNVSILLTLSVVSFEISPTEVYNLSCDGCPYRETAFGLGPALDTARGHDNRHIEFPGNWDFW
ncbi:hypothetical protein ACWIGW_24395 [Nocardia brasiliensis]